MADGARFDINIEANALGVDSTAAQLNAFVEKMTKANTVATQFDNVVNAARARLDEATAAAAAAAQALGAAEGRYKELESAANRAAKEVEKAAAAGKDTSALQAAAEAAKAAMTAQANVVDELREKSLAAAKSQTTLAGTLKAVEAQQSAAAAAYRKAQPAAKSLGDTNALAAQQSKAAADKAAASAAKLTSFAAAGAAAILAVGAAAVVGVLALAKFGFGIQSNVANMQRLQLAQQRMQIGMQKLFKGLQWDKFTRGLEDVMTLFDEGTSSANGMKLLVETIFQPLIDAATKAAPLVKEMFKGLIYGALQVVIAVLKVRNAIWKSLDQGTRAQIKEFADNIFTLKNAFAVGETTAKVLAVAVAALGVAFAIGTIPLLLVKISVERVIAAFEWLQETFGDVIDGIGDFVSDATDAAGDIISGIVDGIKNGAAAIGKAMKDLALGGVKAFKDTLGIHSPSTVMRLQAQYTADGYVQGIEAAAPEVGSALETMATPPELQAGAVSTSTSSTTSTSTSSSTKSVTIQQLTIGGGPVAQDNWAQFRQMLVELVGDGNLTIGGGEAPAT